MYVCLSQAVCLSTFLSVCMSVCLSIGLPVCRSACLRLSVCLSVCLSDQAQAGCLSVTVGLSDSVCVCVCLQVSVCLSVFLSFSVVCLSVTSFCPSFCLFQTPSHSIGLSSCGHQRPRRSGHCSTGTCAVRSESRAAAHAAGTVYSLPTLIGLSPWHGTVTGADSAGLA